MWLLMPTVIPGSCKQFQPPRTWRTVCFIFLWQPKCTGQYFSWWTWVISSLQCGFIGSSSSKWYINVMNICQPQINSSTVHLLKFGMALIVSHSLTFHYTRFTNRQSLLLLRILVHTLIVDLRYNILSRNLHNMESMSFTLILLYWDFLMLVLDYAQLRKEFNPQ